MKRWFHFLLPWLLITFLIVACSTQVPNPAPSAVASSATSTSKPQPQVWEIKGILAALDDPDPGVRDIAFYHLTTYDLTKVANRAEFAEKAIKRLRARQAEPDGEQYRFYHPYATERSSAALALGSLGDAATPYIPELAKLVQRPNNDPEVVSGAIQALGNLGKAASPYGKDILKLVQNPNVGDMPLYAAVEALAKLDSPATPYAQDLLAIGQDQSVVDYFRSQALQAMGKAKTAKNYAQELSQILRTPGSYPHPGCGAAQGLGQLGDAAKPYLENLWNFHQKLDNYPFCALDALGNLDSMAAAYAPKLIAMLQDPRLRAEQHGKAAKLLGAWPISMRPHMRELVDFLKQPNVSVDTQTEVAHALVNLGEATQPYFQELLTLVQNKRLDPTLRAIIALTLGKSDRAVNVFLELLKDPTATESIQVAAIAGLELARANIQPYAKDIVEIAQRHGKIPRLPGLNLAKTSQAYGLRNLGDAAQPFVKDLLAMAGDPRFRFMVRLEAAEAVSNLGTTAKLYTKDIVAVMTEIIPCGFDDQDPFSFSLTQALTQLSPLQSQDLQPLFAALPKNECLLGRQTLRFMLYLYSGGDKAVTSKLAA